MADLRASLDAEVRRVDEDRWLASRFAARDARERLVALYAVNYELARTSEVVREPGIGAIRLAWWRDAIAELAAGRAPRGHAALEALAAAGVDAADAELWRGMVEARAADFEAAPFSSLREMEHYVGATAGALMRLALAACGVRGDAAGLLAVDAGATWGLTGLLRAEPHWRARGRRLMPGEACSHADILTKAREAHARAAGRLRQLPAQAFAAVGYAALAPAYLDALERGREPPPLFVRQLRLVFAAATGRL